MLFGIAQVWDDVVDGDAVAARDANNAFVASLVGIPTNRVAQMMPELPYHIYNVFLRWRDATAIENNAPNKADLHKCYMLRAGLYDIFVLIAAKLYGDDYAAEVGPSIGLTAAANQQLDPAKFYSDYFQGQEFKQLNDQANRNLLATREATGGLRTTSSANLLGSIAPQLAQSAFARQQALQDANYDRQLGLVNVGLNAAGGSNAAAGNAANAMSNLFVQQGAARAGGAAAPYQAASGVLSNLSQFAGLF